MKAGVPPETRASPFQRDETKILITMNARELHHFFALRTCRRAQWEIREMAKRCSRPRGAGALLFERRVPAASVAGAGGKMSCGKPRSAPGIAASGRGRRLMPQETKESSRRRRSSRA